MIACFGAGWGLDVQWSVEQVELIVVLDGNTLLVNASVLTQHKAWDALTCVLGRVKDQSPPDGEEPRLYINVRHRAVSTDENVIVCVSDERDLVLRCVVDVWILEIIPYAW